LLDSAGRLIGVNTAIYSPSGTSAGVGFAIPVDTVNRVVPQIIANGRYEPPQLGIRVHSELSTAITSRMGIQGVLILSVVEGGGADEAGMRGTVIGETDLVQLGDVIQKIGEHDVRNMNEMLEALEHYRAGDSVVVEYLRDGDKRTAEVQLR
jgi:S1-C subfamily serine protease